MRATGQRRGYRDRKEMAQMGHSSVAVPEHRPGAHVLSEYPTHNQTRQRPSWFFPVSLFTFFVVAAWWPKYFKPYL